MSTSGRDFVTGSATNSPQSEMELRNRICVALDYVSPEECLAAAERLGPHAGVLKVGLQSFTSGGPELVRAVARQAPVFLDLKLHDIPVQVGRAVESIADLGVAFTTVHAAGGEAMLKAAAAAAGNDVVVLAVTVLTSLDDGDLNSIGVGSRARDQVLRLAELALNGDVRGLVCSPLEVEAMRDRFGSREKGGPLLVVPGIRPSGAGRDDQRRTLSATAARALGADILVVGRPITRAPDPVGVVKELIEETA